jgi:hypothetical protein
MEQTKMTRPKITIHDLATNEIVEREMNDEEFAVWQADQALFKEEQSAKKAKELAKAALLEKLGITQDEAKLLLS